jgi:hypothetical protein
MITRRLPFWHEFLPAWVTFPPLLSVVAIAIWVGITDSRAKGWHALIPLGLLAFSVAGAMFASRRRRKERASL